LDGIRPRCCHRRTALSTTCVVQRTRSKSLDVTEAYKEKTGPGKPWPALSLGRLPPQESGDIELVVLARVGHRSGAAMGVEPLRCTPLGELRHLLSAARLGWTRPHRRTIGPSRRLG